MLERKAHSLLRKQIKKMDDAFTVCHEHSEMEYARFLLAMIELKAKDFESMQ